MHVAYLRGLQASRCAWVLKANQICRLPVQFRFELSGVSRKHRVYVQVAASEENINEAASAGFDTLETSLQGSEAPYKAPLATVLMALHKYVLSRPLGKLLVLGCCVTGGMLSCASIARISTGLDQAVALPEDSYLQAYYRCDPHCARLHMVPRVWCPWRTALEGCQGLLTSITLFK
jgi:hypothetical protein